MTPTTTRQRLSAALFLLPHAGHAPNAEAKIRGRITVRLDALGGPVAVSLSANLSRPEAIRHTIASLCRELTL